MKSRSFLASAFALSTFALSSTAWPADPPAVAPPAGPTGPTYKNAGLGLSVGSAAGWTVADARSGAPSWTHLCTFSEPVSGAQTTVNSRKTTAGNLTSLRAEVDKLYKSDKSFTVTSILDLKPTATRPMPGIILDAVQSRDEAPPAGSAPGTPPTPVAYRTLAAYFLGTTGTEFLVYSQVRATIFSRVQPAIDKLIQSFSVTVTQATGMPQGATSFRDEKAGFACKYPAAYGVTIPAQPQVMAMFAGGVEAPTIGVYKYSSNQSLDQEAQLLLSYYKGDEVGGEAEERNAEVSGRSAIVVTAHARMDGKDQIFFVAVMKRESDTFRLRVVGEKSAEAKAREVFEAFIASFALTNPIEPPK